jgi:hypothetical protein
MESSEAGDWSRCETIADQKRLNQSELMSCAVDAMQWTDEALRSVR